MHRVLVVDDDLISRMVLERSLLSWGYDVCLAADGIEAVTILEQKRIPIIITDWMMPEMDGIALCRHVRSQPETSHACIIMLTARDEPLDHDIGLAAGADTFLTKPFEVGELREKLEFAEKRLAVAD